MLVHRKAIKSDETYVFSVSMQKSFWPKPRGININMMPFVFGEEEKTIPKVFHSSVVGLF